MAFPQNFFDHWQKISGLPYEEGRAADLVLAIRKRKGLKPELPLLEFYRDRL
jgi:elongation factor 2